MCAGSCTWLECHLTYWEDDTELGSLLAHLVKTTLDSGSLLHTFRLRSVSRESRPGTVPARNTIVICIGHLHEDSFLAGTAVTERALNVVPLFLPKKIWSQHYFNLYSPCCAIQIQMGGMFYRKVAIYTDVSMLLVRLPQFEKRKLGPLTIGV